MIDRWGSNGSQPSKAIYEEEVGKVRKDIVDFHGEMVLLVNYSNINYTGSPWLMKLISSSFSNTYTANLEEVTIQLQSISFRQF